MYTNNMREEEEQVHVDMAIPLLNGKDTDTTIIWISRNDNDNDNDNGSNGECNQRSQNKTRFTLILRALVTLSIIGIFAISSFFLCSSHHREHHNNHDHHHDHHDHDLHNGEPRYSQSEGGGSETLVKSESVLVLAHPLLRGGSGSEGGWALTSSSTPTSTSSTLIIMGGYSFTEHLPVSVSVPDTDTDSVPDSTFVEEMEHEMEHHNNMIMMKMKMAMMTTFMATIAREMEVFDSHEEMFAGSLSGFEEPSSPCPYASSSEYGKMPSMPMSMPLMTTMSESEPEPEPEPQHERNP